MTIIDFPRTGGGGPMTITLGPAAADTTREMAERSDVEAPEVVRRALGTLKMWMDLPPGTDLMVRRPDNRLETLIKWWD